LDAVAEVVSTLPICKSTTQHNNIGADDSTTESETESDHEALHVSLWKQKARNLHKFLEGKCALGSGIQKLLAMLVPDSEGELDLQQDSEKYVSLDTMIEMQGADACAPRNPSNHMQLLAMKRDRWFGDTMETL